MNLKKNITSLLSLFIFLALAKPVYAGLGISPSKFISDNLAKGSHIEKTFILSRSDPVDDLTFKVNMEGSTRDWVTVNKGLTFTMPSGEKRFPIIVSVDVPKDTPNSNYLGSVRFLQLPKQDGKSARNGASTVLSALIQIDLTVVGHQISKYDISTIEIQNTEIGSPLFISLGISNTGNIQVRPKRAHVDIYDQSNKNLLDSKDITLKDTIDPFTSDSIIFSVPISLNLGQYWARISVYGIDEVISKEQNLVFEVLGTGSLVRTGFINQLTVSQQDMSDKLINISALFENTSDYHYSGKLITEIYKNGSMVGIVESDLVSIGAKKTTSLSAKYVGEFGAEYAIRSYVSFAGKTSEVKTTNFKISDEVDGVVLGSKSSIYSIVLSLFALFLIIITMTYSIIKIIE